MKRNYDWRNGPSLTKPYQDPPEPEHVRDCTCEQDGEFQWDYHVNCDVHGVAAWYRDKYDADPSSYMGD
jgi:hypothetical protein